MTRRTSAPVALTIAGSDSGANAGIQADLLAFAANGVYGVTAITCLTAQNPRGISAIHAAPAAFVREQANQLQAFFRPRAAKTGMLFSEEIIAAVADFFEAHPAIRLVVDPVTVATSGKPLLEPQALETLKRRLLPLADVLTPNLDEAGLLVGRALASPEDMESAARELAAAYETTAFVKGGHLGGDELHDIVCEPSGRLHRYSQSRIRDIDTHGSGCTLSAAIAARLARGDAPLAAIEEARRYLRRGMENAIRLGDELFINHFPR